MAVASKSAAVSLLLSELQVLVSASSCLKPSQWPSSTGLSDPLGAGPWGGRRLRDAAAPVQFRCCWLLPIAEPRLSAYMQGCCLLEWPSIMSTALSIAPMSAHLL